TLKEIKQKALLDLTTWEGHISRNCPTRALQPWFNNQRNELRRNEAANSKVGSVN
ncbi:22677_t:CDS:2, partial [Gigaspora rosea]